MVWCGVRTRKDCMGKIRFPDAGSRHQGCSQGLCGSQSAAVVWGKKPMGSKSGASDSIMRWIRISPSCRCNMCRPPFFSRSLYQNRALLLHHFYHVYASSPFLGSSAFGFRHSAHGVAALPHLTTVEAFAQDETYYSATASRVHTAQRHTRAPGQGN